MTSELKARALDVVLKAIKPYWIVTHHPIMQPDGTRVPARTRALYCPATNRVLFGGEAQAAAEILIAD
jgi:hypothetical protein